MFLHLLLLYRKVRKTFLYNNNVPLGMRTRLKGIYRLAVSLGAAKCASHVVDF